MATSKNNRANQDIWFRQRKRIALLATEYQHATDQRA